MRRVILLYIFSILLIMSNAQAQDTLSGNYTNLKIPTGAHVIKEVIRVTGTLEVAPGAKIEMIDAGLIVCEGSVTIKGVQNNIEFFGKKNLEGMGLVIKNIDSSKVVINNTIFRGLQLPLLFDFGWKRDNVEISDNSFINNVGKISVLQVLNPPFNFNTDSTSIVFKVVNNLFTGNNAGIYFEDLRSDHVDIEITNNTFANNLVFGFKNYNISTNYIYGRADQVYTRFISKIENNSFVKNFLIDNITDTIVHTANFGIYGSEKIFKINNNHWGSVEKEKIAKGFYDQSINYSSPKLEFDPFLSLPKEANPAHVYSMKNGENATEFQDSITIKDQLKSIILVSNKKLNYSKATLNYVYFKKDSTMDRADTLLTFNPQDVNGTTAKLDITKTVASQKHVGYYTIKGILGANNEIVPDVKIGYQAYLLDYRKHKIFVDSLKMKRDTVPPKPKELDSVKNQFQKIETPQKSRIELSLLAGGTIFTGTISNPSLLNNEMNVLFGVNIGYTLYSNLSAGLSIFSSKLSNSDANSSNNEQIARGMSFITSILGISPSINFDFVDNRLYTKARKFRPSIGVGFDFISFTPTGLFKGKLYNLQPLGTGGQLLDSTKKIYSTMAMGYFLNLKLKYQFNRFNSAGIFFSFHQSLSDYLDDVGPDEYPNVAKLLAKSKTDGDAAAYFSNPTSRPVTSGQYRNSPNGSKDSFVNFGIFYARKLFK
jgi:Domain of unknown function (DUF6089)